MNHGRILSVILLLLALAIITGCAAASQPPSTLTTNCSGDTPDASCNVIGGSKGNAVSQGASGATISGGGERDLPNRIAGDYGTISGGLGNQAGDRATVGGGSYNEAMGYRATVGGGSSNTALTAYATIAGGENNIANYFYATIGGGGGNVSSGRYSTIAGGSGNVASFTHATVAGGSYNTASSINSTVGGGDTNIASGAFSTVSGGSNNHASGFDTLVAGGSGNFATGDNAAIGGGIANRAYADYSTIAGGNANVVGTPNAESKSAHYSAIGGGTLNTATGAFSTIPGGSSNRAAGDYSFAAGRRAIVSAAHAGTFLFADSSDADFNSAAANEFAARATGGVRFVTAIDSAGNPSAGVRLPQGSGSWESLSDRSAKENVAPVDGREILPQLAAIPISTWNYKTQDPSIRHIGPMAQDFRAFGVGEDDKYISMIDASGVALAAAQGLYELDQEQAQQIANLKAENAALGSHIDALSSRVDALEQNARAANRPVESSFFSPPNLILFVGVGILGFVLGRRRSDI